MKIQQISQRNYMVTFQLDNWDLHLYYILGEHNTYLIDTGLGSACVLPVLEELKKKEKPIILINTHHHWDHVWGNHCLEDHTIVAHTACRDLMLENWQTMYSANKAYAKGETGICLPNVLFGSALYFPEDNIRLLHTPGHTADSISILDEIDGVLNVGDNIGDSSEDPEDIIPSLYTNKEVYKQTITLYKKVNANIYTSGHNTPQPVTVFDEILNQLTN